MSYVYYANTRCRAVIRKNPSFINNHVATLFLSLRYILAAGICFCSGIFNHSRVRVLQPSPRWFWWRASFANLWDKVLTCHKYQGACAWGRGEWEGWEKKRETSDGWISRFARLHQHTTFKPFSRIKSSLMFFLWIWWGQWLCLIFADARRLQLKLPE